MKPDASPDTGSSTRIALLGSTGSIGQSTLKVVRDHPRRFQVVGLAAGSNETALLDQAREFRPRAVAVADPEARRRLAASGALPPGCRLAADAAEIASLDDVDVVVAGITGARGLAPVLAGLERGRRIALANKETLVAAGELVTRVARRHGGTLIPVDSEHSALFQCLHGEDPARVRKLILTASGGPFRGWTRADLETVTPEQALRHPNWSMGAKITIDSATLMNKGLEVIEACWLFGVPAGSVQVVVHPQSIVHSMVEFIDGSILAQLGVPTMQLPIQYALGYPDRLEGFSIPRLDPWSMGPLTFEKPDTGSFPCLRLALEAADRGLSVPTVLNAANEIAVAAFLEGRLAFPGIPGVLERVLEAHDPVALESLDAVLDADAWARARAREEAVAWTR